MQLIVGLVLFLGIHSVPMAAPRLYARLAEQSEMRWKAVYTVSALAGLALIGVGYDDYAGRATVIYVHPLWWRQVTAVLMLPVFSLLLAPYFPGLINKYVRHPRLMAVILWSASHLMMHGSIADIMLFGSFLVWALTGYVSLNDRKQRWLPQGSEALTNTVIVTVLGLGLYAAFLFWLHAWLIGVRPLIMI